MARPRAGHRRLKGGRRLGPRAATGCGLWGCSAPSRYRRDAASCVPWAAARLGRKLERLKRESQLRRLVALGRRHLHAHAELARGGGDGGGAAGGGGGRGEDGGGGRGRERRLVE